METEKKKFLAALAAVVLIGFSVSQAVTAAILWHTTPLILCLVSLAFGILLVPSTIPEQPLEEETS